MPEESKAQKLAAARKKLKEYQKRGAEALIPTGTEVQTDATPPAVVAHGNQQYAPATGSVSSDLSERSESEAEAHEDAAAANGQTASTILTVDCATVVQSCNSGVDECVTTAVATAASYFSAASATAAGADAFLVQSNNIMPHAVPMPTVIPPRVMQVSKIVELKDPPQVNAIQVLVAEQAQLTSELSKWRNACREKDLELEELRAEHDGTAQRFDELQQRYATQQQPAEQLRHSNAELQLKLAQASTSREAHAAQMAELRQQLDAVQTRASDLEHQHKTTLNELEMAQLRIRQVSDEASVSVDNRVETLTQTQFMYEQQIRDLQAMVQQLSQDKEAANGQYQNYVQHLNAELGILHEQHTEALDVCSKLQERERQLVDHVGCLEREIQRSISRRSDEEAQRKEQEQQKPESSGQAAAEVAMNSNEVAALQERLTDFEFERHEFQLKIKSQEDRLIALNAELEQRRSENEKLSEQLARIVDEQPDAGKLLATMESDKVAASRALMQNGELKQQVDDMERRFVELTNDKADLMVRLDAEAHVNREMRTQLSAMEERVRQSDERFRFKDEEMIRLSHENMELARKSLVLQQQVDRLQHYEVKEYSEKYEKPVVHERTHDQLRNHDHSYDHDHSHVHDHSHDHSHNHDHLPDREHDYLHSHSHDHNVDAENHDSNHNKLYFDKHNALSTPTADSCQETNETPLIHTHNNASTKCSGIPHMQSRTLLLPTTEAVGKLEKRFTQLMSHVADLTDEKQRLEHLVLQLQSETETIGEYITLYQTQRRMLKQREYEKAAQMRLLQTEREQLREKIMRLNALVSSLGVELPAAFATSYPSVKAPDEAQSLVDDQRRSEEETAAYNEDKLYTLESQEILTKIQTIISEIKENTLDAVPTVTHTIDHLNCCLGKIEVV